MHKWHIIKLLLLEFQAWNFNIMLQACYSHLGYIETPTKSWLTTKSCITVSLWEANEIRFYCSRHYLFTESWYVEYRERDKGVVKFVRRIKLNRGCFASVILAKWRCVVRRNVTTYISCIVDITGPSRSSLVSLVTFYDF